MNMKNRYVMCVDLMIDELMVLLVNRMKAT
jgi:hypothetical protein